MLEDSRSKRMRPGRLATATGRDDPRVLKKKIAELEEENRSLRDLVEVLKNLPAAREQPAPRPRKKREAKKRGKKEVSRGGEGPGGAHAGGEGDAAPR
ncbi:MAG: hypothetical protein L0Y66_05705 [Myxococcaceae bacterium]|nr:hypothetical protein [Myxococcaceae bacterium]